MVERTMPEAHTEQFALPSEDTLSAALQQGLQEALYSNRLMIAPRRIREFAREEARFFLQAGLGNDEEQLRARGRHLAEQGLGLRSVTNLSAAVRRTCLEQHAANGTFFIVLEMVDRYAGALLDGYFNACQEELRRELQLTQEAYRRSVQP